MSATNLLHHPVIKAVCVDTTSGMYGGSASLMVYSGCVQAEFTLNPISLQNFSISHSF